MYGVKQIYQFGQYVFNKQNLTSKVSGGFKTVQENQDFMDGNARVNGRRRNYKNNYEFDVSFLADEYENIDKIQYEFVNEPQLIFFTAEYSDDNKNVYTKVFWNYAECLSFEQDASQSESLGQKNKMVKVKFGMFSPFFYEANDNIFLVDEALYKSNAILTYGQAGLTWGQATKYWGSSNFDHFVRLNTFTDSELTIKLKSKKERLKLVYTDRYLNVTNTNRGYNFLNRTDDLTDSVWQITSNNLWGGGGTWSGGLLWGGGQILPANTQELAPNGTNTATKVTFNNLNSRLFQILSGNFINLTLTASIWAKGVSGQTLKIGFNASDNLGAILNDYSQIVTFDGNWQKIAVQGLVPNSTTANIKFYLSNDSPQTAVSFTIWRPQMEQGIQATQYQTTISNELYEMNGIGVLKCQINNNSPTRYTTTSLSLKNSFKSKYILVRIPQLKYGESIQILNLDNQTGYKITWLSSKVVKEGLLLYAHKGQLFDVTTGYEINPEDELVKIETALKGQLTFDSRINTFLYETNPIDTLEITKNTASPISIFIKNLHIFH